MAEEPPSDQPDQTQEYKPVSHWFIIVLLRTRKGLSLLDKVGRWRVTSPLGWLMLLLTPIGAALALYVIGLEVSTLYFSPEGAAIASSVRTISPLANFLLPGINPYLPLSVWMAVAVTVFIHEASHGIVARGLGVKVKAAGLVFLAFLPIGAFVEVDEKEMRRARSRDSLRVLGAGSGINFIVGVACFLLLLFTVSTMTPTVKGAAIIGVVSPTSEVPSPAYTAGIHPGDFLTAINGDPVTDLSVLHNGSFYIGEKVSLTVWRDGKTLVFNNVALANYTTTTINETSGQSSTVSYPFLGVDTASYQSLQSVVSSYLNVYKVTPLAYVVEIPTFGNYQYTVPFSDVLSGFYTSDFGASTPLVTSALFWLFFVNFNLAIFNSLPIYPMDGGQAFETFLRGAGKGKISDALARKVTTGVTLVVFLALFSVIAGPYISGVLPSY